MEEYREMLKGLGLDDEHIWRTTSKISDMHELFSQASDQDRFILQELLGEKLVRTLEEFGSLTRKQSRLFVEPDMNAEPHPLDAEPDSSDEELKEADAYDDAEAYAERMHP
tara:strand:- start:339 stop:671 length:333 start_codon:yes stop_codon:yes gene_type:complete